MKALIAISFVMLTPALLFISLLLWMEHRPNGHVAG